MSSRRRKFDGFMINPNTGRRIKVNGSTARRLYGGGGGNGKKPKTALELYKEKLKGAPPIIMIIDVDKLDNYKTIVIPMTVFNPNAFGIYYYDVHLDESQAKYPPVAPKKSDHKIVYEMDKFFEELQPYITKVTTIPTS